MLNIDGMLFDTDEKIDTKKREENKIKIDKHQYFSFFVCGKIFAIELLKIKEIIEYQKATKVPNTQKTIKGIVNTRGIILPIIDLSSRFGLDDNFSYGKRACIVIVEEVFKDKSYTMGLLIERINSVLNILPKNISNRPDYGLPIKKVFVLKIGKEKNEFYPILNLQTLLNINELSLRGDGK